MSRRRLNPAQHQRARGLLELDFEVSVRGTELAELFQSAPLRALFPTPEPDEVPIAAVVNIAGGLAGGDALDIAVRLGAGARATVSAATAEKVYRSLGPATRIDTKLQADTGAWLEWIPQETILFDGARLERRITMEIAADARLLMAEILVFGRSAHGETLRSGLVRDSWRLRRDGVMLWADGLLLDGDPSAALAAPLGFAGAEALGTVLYGGEGAEALRDGLRDAVARSAAPGGTLLAGTPGGVTIPRPGLLLGRWLGDAQAVRGAVADAVMALRSRALGLPPRLPRLWTN